MSLFGENTTDQKAHSVWRPGQPWTGFVEVKPLAGPSEGSLVRPSLRTAFFTRIFQEGPSAVARTSHPLGPRVTSQNTSTTSTSAIPWRQEVGRQLCGEVGGSLCGHVALATSLSLSWGRRWAGMFLFPLPPSCLRCSNSPARMDGRPAHSEESVHPDHVEPPWEMGETASVSCSPALLTENFASSLSTCPTPGILPILHASAPRFPGRGGSGALKFPSDR